MIESVNPEKLSSDFQMYVMAHACEYTHKHTCTYKNVIKTLRIIFKEGASEPVHSALSGWQWWGHKSRLILATNPQEGPLD